MNTYCASSPEIEYQDSKMMYIGIPLMTLFVVHVGLEEGLGSLLSNSLYYENLVVSLAIAYLTFFSIRSCILGFDQWMPWKEDQNRWRWGLQLFTCAIITSFWLVVNDFYDYIMLGEPELLDVVLLTVDWPVSLLLIAGLNYYYYVQFEQARRHTYEAGRPNEVVADNTQVLLKVPGGVQRTEKSDVRLICLHNNLSCIVDKDGKKRWSSQSLRVLEKEFKLDAAQYFRLNRKLLIHRAAVKGYKRTEGHRLKLELYYESAVQPMVSKNKAASFKSWWHQSKSLS
ncbi:MAG: LytTR family transcriptional regulator [Saprospiraceae bacterium]|nr:LytTR family transcriptional regulator [Saprospiraceae bacterium]